MHINNGKLSPRAIECIFLGLWCSESKSRKLILSRDVIFNEDALLSSGKQSFVSSSTNTGNIQGSNEKVEFEFKSAVPGIDVPSSSTNESNNDHHDDDECDDKTTSPIQQQGDDYSIARDRARRQIRKSARYTNDYLTTYALSIAQEVNDGVEPVSYTEVVSCAESSQWLGAMNEEIQSLYKNNTWTLTELPKDKRPLKCKWIHSRD